MIQHWERRRNKAEADELARVVDRSVGTVDNLEDERGHVDARVVPESVRAYTLRLRLWAADVERGLR